MPVSNADIAKVFDEIADLLELGDENPFRVRAYRNAARIVGGVAIDLAGTRRGDDYSNRYFATTIKTDPDGAVTIDLRDAGSRSRGDTNPGWFSYKRIGSLRNGVHVLETWDNGGGSGIFTSLLFVKFAIDDDYSQGASDAFLRRQTIVIKRVGEFTLGDRYGGKVVVRGATVEVGADDRNRKKAVVLRMP